MEIIMDIIASVIIFILALIGLMFVSIAALLFIGSLFSREDIDEACGVCCKCGTDEAPIDVQGKLYCIACIRKNRKSMGEYRAMPWHSGGCSK